MIELERDGKYMASKDMKKECLNRSRVIRKEEMEL